MKRRSAPRDFVEALLAGVAVASMERLPLPMAQRLGRFYAGVLDRAVPRLRRTAERNLSLAYPDKDPAWRQRTVDEVFESIGRVLVSFARFPSITRDNVRNWIAYEGFEHYERARQRGKGILFATAHLGNWELSAYAHALLTEPMNVVVRPLDNSRVDEIVETRRARSGNKLLSKRDFARGILYALRANEPVGVLVDQNSSADNGAFVNFFGMEACANLTFAKLAARSGAAVIPGFAIWDHASGKYILRFYPEVEISGDPALDTARVQAAIEAAIRETPGQWLWIHRRWKTRRPGDPNLYCGL